MKHSAGPRSHGARDIDLDAAARAFKQIAELQGAAFKSRGVVRWAATLSWDLGAALGRWMEREPRPISSFGFAMGGVMESIWMLVCAMQGRNDSSN